MAEARRFADLKFGHAGNLIYEPIQKDGETPEKPGHLHSSLVKIEAPYFKQLGTTSKVYEASCSKPPELTHSHVFAESNLQKRWLQKSHPEAFEGVSAVPRLLTEEIQRFRKADESASPNSILAVGEIVDRTMTSKPTALPVLATATGEAGELLRLTRIEDSEWSWDGRNECTLRLGAIDCDVEVDEVVWASDALPITQLKFAKSAAGSGVNRWLLVQKPTSTMLFRPEFSKAPKTRSHSYQTSGPVLSRIDPKHMVTLTHRQTGGNAHVDMAFNPPIDDRPPQLCVMDECGYWTLWNLSSRGRMGREAGLILYRGGHIWEGPLTAIPSAPLYPIDVHGALFVGTEHDNAMGLSQEATEASRSTVRSRLILLWNSERLRIVDVEANAVLSDFPGLTTTKKYHGNIVNVQISPVDQNHVYILTARFVIWIELVSSRNEIGPAVKPKLRLTCPHTLPDGNHLKLAVIPYPTPDGDSTLVHVYSSSHNQISAHWFHLAPGSERHQWHSQLFALSVQQRDSSRQRSSFRDLLFLPLSINRQPKARGPGARYAQENVRFFQGWLVGHDLSVHYCICVASTKPEMEVRLPDTRLRWSNLDKVRKVGRKRKVLARFLRKAAVVPDAMTDEAVDSLRRLREDLDEEEESGDDDIVGTPRPIKLNLSRLASALDDLNAAQRGTGVPVALLEAIQGAMQHGSTAGKLPLTTWQEFADSLDPNEDPETMPPQDIEEVAQGMMFGAGDEAVIMQLGRPRGKEPERTLGSLMLLEHQLSKIWVESLRDRMSEAAVQKRALWVSELAKDLFLSTHGVIVQDVPLFGQSQTIKAGDGQSSQPSLPSLNPVQSSQPSSAVPSPPASSTGSTALPDEAFQRLSLLATNIQPGATGLSKPAAVLEFWPEERGVDPTDYVSSVAIAADKKFDYARQRLQKIEGKRKAMTEKYKRPAFKRKGFPDSEPDLPIRPPTRSSVGPPAITSETQTMSSQLPPLPNVMSSQGPAPGSSQAQTQTQARGGVTMSQVVPGAFGGDRKKAKKTKKKSGFR